MISIIIPVYNAEKYILETLTSIKQQTVRDLEVLCIIDGSPDNSEAICREFASMDDRFKVYVQPNAGVSAARNLGLSKVNGEYVCFIDADDYVIPEYLDKLLGLTKDGDMPICSYSRDKDKLSKESKSTILYKSKDYIRHIFNEDIEHPNICMMLFKNSIIQMQHLDFHVGCIKNEDTEFYIKYMTHCGTIVFSDFKGYYYRPNPTSVMNSGLNFKSLTSIEAQERMAKYLVDAGIYEENNHILSNSVQVYVFSAARSKNLEIYDYLHSKYDVKYHMKKELWHPRLGRKGVSLAYLLLGKKWFFRVMSITRR